jgi:SAM-dependent methyltransferase
MNEGMNNKFTKYEKKGAYHWSSLYDEGWMRSSPRLHARYDIPIWLLSQRMSLPKSRGIDVGCGDGVLLYKVRRKGGVILGLDHSDEGLTLAREQLDRRNVFSGNLIKGSCYQIPLDSESVDYVTAIELIEHLDDVDAFLNETKRILRPGGWFVCTTPNREKGQAPDEVRDPFHVHEYIPRELQSALNKQFSEVEILGAYPEYLDRLYVRNRGSGILDKATRVFFRAVAFGISNPYELALSEDPTHKSRLLIGVGQKKSWK